MHLPINNPTFLILRRIQRDIINLHRSSCEVPVILVRFGRNFNSVDKFSENTQKLNFMKIRPVGAELFHAERHDKANSRFSKFCEGI
jgi:hypothetical protein